MSDTPINNKELSENLSKLIDDINKAKKKKDGKGVLYWLFLLPFSFAVGLWNVAVMAYGSLLIWKMHLTPSLEYTPDFLVFVGALYLLTIARIPTAFDGQNENAVKTKTFSDVISISLAILFLTSLITGCAWLFTLFV